MKQIILYITLIITALVFTACPIKIDLDFNKDSESSQNQDTSSGDSGDNTNTLQHKEVRYVRGIHNNRTNQIEYVAEWSEKNIRDVSFSIDPKVDGISIDEKTGRLFIGKEKEYSTMSTGLTGIQAFTITAQGNGQVAGKKSLNINIDITNAVLPNTKVCEMPTTVVTTKAELSAEIASAIATQGDNANLNYIDTSQITDMSKLFQNNTTFNGDISCWDLGNVTNIANMFNGATAFNGDLSVWYTVSVIYMEGVFMGASAFNGNISDWNTSSVVYANNMFNGATAFNQDISQWDVSKVVHMQGMFNGASAFNQDISRWDTSSVVYMMNTFQSTTAFNQDLSSWNVGTVIDYTDIFKGSSMEGIYAQYPPFGGIPQPDDGDDNGNGGNDTDDDGNNGDDGNHKRICGEQLDPVDISHINDSFSTGRDRPLWYAINTNNPTEIAQVVNNGANINARWIDYHYAPAGGSTPLIYAINTMRFNAVQYLVNNGAHMELPHKHHLRMTPIGYAIQQVIQNSHKRDIFDYLLSKGARLDGYNVHGQTLLYYAISKKPFNSGRLIRLDGNKQYIIDRLVESCVDVNAKNSDGNTALMKLFKEFGTIASEFYPIAKYVAQLPGTDYNQIGEDGNRLIHRLINRDGYFSNGATYSLDADGSDSKSQIQDLMSIVITSQNLNAKNNAGITPLMLAAQKDLNTVKFLVGKGADISVKNDKNSGATAISYAISASKKDIVEYLLSLQGIEDVVTDRDLSLATDTAIVDMLVNSGLVGDDSISQRNLELLFEAAKKFSISKLKYAINKGVNPSSKNALGETILTVNGDPSDGMVADSRTRNIETQKERTDFYNYVLGLDAMHAVEENIDIFRITDVNVMKAFIGRGHNAFIKDKYGRTLLHYAALDVNLELTKYLIEEVGLDMTLEDQWKDKHPTGSRAHDNYTMVALVGFNHDGKFYGATTLEYYQYLYSRPEMSRVNVNKFNLYTDIIGRQTLSIVEKFEGGRYYGISGYFKDKVATYLRSKGALGAFE